MSYDQQHSRHAGQSRRGQRPPGGGSRESGNYGEGYGANSYETNSYDVPSYEPSTYETQRLWEDNRDYRQGEGYRGQQNFRGNRDYRSTQEDYRSQQDYEIAEPGERGDVFERSGREPWGLQRNQPGQQQDWDQYPQRSSQPGGYGGSSGYRSAQFAGRQQIPDSQAVYGRHPQHYYGGEFGNARRQYAGDEAGFGRGQRWGGTPQQAQFGWDQGNYRQPQGASPGWQNNPSRHGNDYFGAGRYEADFGGASGSYAGAGGNDFQNWGYQGGEEDYRNRPQGHRGRAPKGYERSDERIREDICERLTNDQRVDASDVSVTVKAGVVTLEGSIRDRNQKYQAEDISDNVSGVKDVQNRLNVARSAQGNTSDQERTDNGRMGQQDKQDDPGKTSSRKITRQ